MSSSLIASTITPVTPTLEDLESIAESLRHPRLKYADLGLINDRLESWELPLSHLAEYWYLRATARELLSPAYKANERALKCRKTAADCANNTPEMRRHYAEHRFGALDMYSQHSSAMLEYGQRMRYVATAQRALRDLEALAS